MKSVLATTQFEWVIQKSRFIGFLVHATTLDDVARFVEECRHTHPQSTHVCHACILSSTMVAERASDDGEPQKTAGIPMLEILKKNDLTDVVAVVVRYFGGLRLGAGGLIRAYAKTIRSCVETTVFTWPQSYDECQLTVDYAQSGPISTYLRSACRLADESYGEQAVYHFICPSEETPIITEEIKKRTSSDLQVQIVRTVTRFESH